MTGRKREILDIFVNHLSIFVSQVKSVVAPNQCTMIALVSVN